MMCHFQVRRGFTLVELLVVTGLIASMLGLVVTGMRAGGSYAGQVRRSAQSLASAFIAAQSRSLGKPEGAALIIDPVGNQGQSVSEALMYPFITGAVSGIPTSDPSASSAQITVVPDNADVSDLLHGYRIQFSQNQGIVQPSTAWLACALNAAGSGTASLRTPSGQTPQNTIWPKTNGAAYASIARYPDMSGAVVNMENQVAIDLRYSGVGDEPSAPYGRLDNRGAIAVTFDRTGAVGDIMQQVLSTTARSVGPDTPRQPIFFFLALRSDIDSPTVNVLSKQDAVWVTVFPLTGHVAVSSNVPQSGSDATALAQARANARLGIPIGK